MKRFSAWSMCLIILGIVLVSVSDRIENQVELTYLLGIITCLVGVIFSFVAISIQEEGMLKFISLSSFFMVFFLISWFEPFHFIRVFTWLKNIV